MTKHILAEFGGTNARFALVSPESPGRLENLVRRPCAEFSSAEQAVAWYMKQVGCTSAAAGCISIAGPTDTASYRLTNRDWILSPERMKSLIGAKRVEFLNDFEALAYALPFLPGKNLAKIREGVAVPAKPMVVLGPGTGLGVAGLIPKGDGSFTVVKSEGGGIGFAPEDSLERDVMLHLNRQIGRVTCEDLLCGRGMVRLYGAVADVLGVVPATLTAAEISGKALADGDELCARTAMAFCHILGHFAGDLALMFNATGGVFLGGGILPQIKDILLESDFCTRFEARGAKSHLVADTPVFLIEDEVPALIGASYWLIHQLSA